MRIDLVSDLGQYILCGDAEWQETKQRAGLVNPWFTPEFIDIASKNIATYFLDKEKLNKWMGSYRADPPDSKKIGVVMAGNIPLVGFHDLLCVFLSGHKTIIKASSKDDVLIKHLAKKLAAWNPQVEDLIRFEEMLKGCDAYIATGSNNSARYFEYYFKKYPNIIRRNRTSIAVLDGEETNEELEKLADDIHLYFGMGCRNVTKIYVPKDYDFVPLLSSFKKYSYFKEHHKYRNNYDYNLALHILNGKFYMTRDSIILVENPSIFSPISQLNYEFYTDKNELKKQVGLLDDLQSAVGHGYIPFGQAQLPSLTDFADGIDTMKFLTEL